jgi:hypothetical protein
MVDVACFLNFKRREIIHGFAKRLRWIIKGLVYLFSTKEDKGISSMRFLKFLPLFFSMTEIQQALLFLSKAISKIALNSSKVLEHHPSYMKPQQRIHINKMGHTSARRISHSAGFVSALCATVQDSAPCATVQHSALWPTVQDSALWATVMDSVLRATVQDSALWATVQDCALWATVQDSAL